MKTNKLLVAAVLATAVGTPIAGFGRDMNMPQPTTSPGVRVPFLHGWLILGSGVLEVAHLGIVTLTDWGGERRSRGAW